jgi:hypothetical protein
MSHDVEISLRKSSPKTAHSDAVQQVIAIEEWNMRKVAAARIQMLHALYAHHQPIADLHQSMRVAKAASSTLTWDTFNFFCCFQLHISS